MFRACPSANDSRFSIEVAAVSTRNHLCSPATCTSITGKVSQRSSGSSWAHATGGAIVVQKNNEERAAMRSTEEEGRGRRRVIWSMRTPQAEEHTTTNERSCLFVWRV